MIPSIEKIKDQATENRVLNLAKDLRSFWFVVVRNLFRVSRACVAPSLAFIIDLAMIWPRVCEAKPRISNRATFYARAPEGKVFQFSKRTPRLSHRHRCSQSVVGSDGIRRNDRRRKGEESAAGRSRFPLRWSTCNAEVARVRNILGSWVTSELSFDVSSRSLAHDIRSRRSGVANSRKRYKLHIKKYALTKIFFRLYVYYF